MENNENEYRYKFHEEDQQEGILSSGDQQEDGQYAGEQQEVNKQEFRVVGFWTRLFAYVIDLIAISSLTLIAINPILSLVGLGHLHDLFFITFSFIGLFAAVYFIIMTKIWGQTLGKMIFRIKVVKQDGQALTWMNAIFREGIGRIVSQAFGFHLGYIWIAFHPQKRSWHDLIEETFVIYDPKVTAQRNVMIENIPSSQ